MSLKPKPVKVAPGARKDEPPFMAALVDAKGRVVRICPVRMGEKRAQAVADAMMEAFLHGK